MKIKSMIADVSEFLKSRVFLILWISLVIYLFYDTFTFYKYGPQFYYLRRILGLGLCISRGTATVLNLSCALVLLPFCKKINQVLNRILSKLCPELFFFWLESAKSFHMNIAVTLLLFGVIHSISHFANLWNFSRNYDQNRPEINFANYKNENPLRLLMSVAGMTGVLMLLIILGMGLTSARFVRRRTYNAFWYTHQLYLPFMVLLLIHPLVGVLKEEVLEENDPSLNPSRIKNLTNSVIYTRLFDTPKFMPIKSKHWMWMSAPLCCFLIDLLWRIFSRNLARIEIAKIRVMPGRTICLTLSKPYEQFAVRIGQYVLLQCQQISLLEWHPFTVVKVPTSSQNEFVVWIRVKGDWTETLEKLLFQKLHAQIRMLVDGPFSSPMEGVMRSDVAICVAAGVGITPFVAVLHNMYLYPRNVLPGRIHLIWIVRYEKEITWLAELASKTINQLRYANRPDRLHLEFYVTNSEIKDIAKVQNSITHMVVIDGKTGFTNVINKNERVLTDDEKTSLLTPNVKKKVKRDVEIALRTDDIVRQYPVLGCRIRRGRPYWDKTFGYWVHLYPGDHLNLFCCGPKKLVKLLRNKCKMYTKNTKTKFAFIHEGFS